MASALTVGNEVHIASGGFGYSTTVLYYTRVNDARLTDDLVIYDRTFGNYTKTIVYGYELVVSVAASHGIERPKVLHLLHRPHLK